MFWMTFRRPRALALLLLALAAGCSSAPRHFAPRPGQDYSLGLLHIVSKGEYLSSIGAFYQRNSSLLAKLNELKPPYLLHPGDCLYIPPDNSDRIVREGRLRLGDISELCRHRGRWPDTAKGDKSVPHKRAANAKTAASGGGSGKLSALARVFRSKKNAGSKKWPGGKRRPVAPPLKHSTDYAWPLTGRYVRGFSTAWRKPHKGVDIAVPNGADVRAARAGEVLWSKTMGTYGNLVIVDHGDGFASLYAHNSVNLVKAGQRVRQGQVVARAGSTGRSTGPHLHFELRYNGVAVDPEKYLPKTRKGTLVASRK